MPGWVIPKARRRPQAAMRAAIESVQVTADGTIGRVYATVTWAVYGRAESG